MIAGIGFSEIAIIILVAIIFFKPEDIPGILRQVAGVVKKIERFTREARKEINDVIAEPPPFADEYQKNKTEPDEKPPV